MTPNFFDAGNGLPLQLSDATLTVARSFNGYGELDSQSVSTSGQQVSSWTVSRDTNGRIIRKTEIVGGISAAFDYEYDPMGATAGQRWTHLSSFCGPTPVAAGNSITT